MNPAATPSISGRSGAGKRKMRVQLSLYVSGPAAGELAAVRQVVDPVQSALIPPHVTLCRDAELAGIAPEEIRTRLAARDARAVTLAFGPVERFGGHGLLLPCVEGHAAFRALRALILGVAVPQEQVPHLTLAHPRNPRASGNDIAVARALPAPLVTTFTHVHWIEQEDRTPWRIRHTYRLSHFIHR